jgi:hypothetical protein
MSPPGHDPNLRAAFKRKCPSTTVPSLDGESDWAIPPQSRLEGNGRGGSVGVDSQFDVRLLRSLIHKNGSTSNQELERIAGSAAGIRLLEIMSEVSDGTHLLSTVMRLMSHPDPRVRSKAALLVGRSNKNHKWVQERLGESDARVRANAVESLWGADNAGSRAVFWSALGDEHEEFQPRTAWSLSNAFTSAFKELDAVPQFRATAKLGPFLERTLR